MGCPQCSASCDESDSMCNGCRHKRDAAEQLMNEEIRIKEVEEAKIAAADDLRKAQKVWDQSPMRLAAFRVSNALGLQGWFSRPEQPVQHRRLTRLFSPRFVKLCE